MISSLFIFSYLIDFFCSKISFPRGRPPYSFTERSIVFFALQFSSNYLVHEVDFIINYFLGAINSFDSLYFNSFLLRQAYFKNYSLRYFYTCECDLRRRGKRESSKIEGGKERMVDLMKIRALR